MGKRWYGRVDRPQQNARDGKISMRPAGQQASPAVKTAGGAPKSALQAAMLIVCLGGRCIEMGIQWVNHKRDGRLSEWAGSGRAQAGAPRSKSPRYTMV